MESMKGEFMFLVLNILYCFMGNQVCSFEKSFLAYSEFISTIGIWKTVKRFNFKTNYDKQKK